MLATQILLNNLLYDVSEIGIPFDNVRAADIAKPQHWRMQDIIRFAAVMGPLSSVFDLATFGGAVSVVSNRSRSVPHRLVRGIHRHADLGGVSDPHPRTALAGHAQSGADDLDTGGSGGGLGDPVLPVGEWFGFQGLPLPLTIALVGIVVIYLVCAELFKPLAIAGGLRHDP